MVGAVPEHILVRPSVPQLALLARCSAVVTHGGVNTVNECLIEGVPMVLAPIRDDQPIVAGRVATVGAGSRCAFGRVQPAEMAMALAHRPRQPLLPGGCPAHRCFFALAVGAPAGCGPPREADMTQSQGTPPSGRPPDDALDLTFALVLHLFGRAFKEEAHGDVVHPRGGGAARRSARKAGPCGPHPWGAKVAGRLRGDHRLQVGAVPTPTTI